MMRIFLALLCCFLLCCLLAGCGDKFVGTWQPVKITMFGKTAPVPESDRSDLGMTVTKSGSTYTYKDKKSGNTLAGTKEGDKLVFTEEKSPVKCEAQSAPDDASHLVMKYSPKDPSKLPSENPQDMSIVIEYERAKGQ